jgi:uncharacterized membrane protein YbaN (DUF454 family)
VTPKPLPESLPKSRFRTVRALWIAVGFVCVGLGVIGALVPVMPSTGFFVAAAFCFARGSDRWLNWLLALPTVGPLVRDYRAGLGMPLRAKVIAVSMLTLAVTISVLRLTILPARIGATALGLVGVWFILVRVPTKRD